MELRPGAGLGVRGRREGYGNYRIVLTAYVQGVPFPPMQKKSKKPQAKRGNEPATKADVQGLAKEIRSTRADIQDLRRDMASKSDLSEMASKRDMSDMEYRIMEQLGLLIEHNRTDNIASYKDDVSLLKDRVTRLEKHTGLARAA